MFGVQLQLRKALLSCIEATLISGAIEDLAALFEEKGQSVNPKLKQLIGQVKLLQNLSNP